MMPTVSPVLRPSYLPPVELHRPNDLGELFACVAAGASPLAGGTDLVVWASQRGEPRQLAWTGGIDEWHIVDISGQQVRIGAAVPLSRIARSGELRSLISAVIEGASVVGSVQLRNQATLVGNVCTASPGGDTLPGLYVHDAMVDVVNAAGSHRSIKISEFICAPGKTNLAPGELVAGVTVRGLGPLEGSAFCRFTQRNALDLALASVAARVRFESDEQTVAQASIALGAVGPTVLDAGQAAALLVGRTLEPTQLRECANLAAECCQPITDHRASADYRRQLVRALTEEIVLAAAKQVTAGCASVEAS